MRDSQDAALRTDFSEVSRQALELGSNNSAQEHKGCESCALHAGSPNEQYLPSPNELLDEIGDLPLVFLPQVFDQRLAGHHSSGTLLGLCLRAHVSSGVY